MKRDLQALPKSLDELRHLPGMLSNRPQQSGGAGVLSSPALPAGIPAAGLTEICGGLGRGKTALVFSLLRESRLRAAWIEDALSIYPPAFPQHGIELARLLFVEAGPAISWAVQQVLRSKLFPLVIVSHSHWPALALRRLQLAAEKAPASVVLLTEVPIREGAWTLAKRVHA